MNSITNLLGQSVPDDVYIVKPFKICQYNSVLHCFSLILVVKIHKASGQSAKLCLAFSIDI